MIDNIYYTELRKNGCEVKELMKGEASDSIKENYTKTIDLLKKICIETRREGILWLNEYMDELSDKLLADELKYMFYLAMHGNDPELVEQIMLQRYFANNYSGLEGSMMLIYIKVLFGIQNNIEAQILFEEIKSLVPKELSGGMDEIAF